MSSNVAEMNLQRKPLFGSSGIRQVMGKEVMQLALQVGLVTGKNYPRVVVGRDTRTSSEALKSAFVAGLLAGGANVYDAGVTPTPTLALAAKEFDAAAMITASHNPPEYNGIKLLNPDGSAFDAAQRRNIEDKTLENSSDTVPWNQIGSVTSYEEAIKRHINYIINSFPGKFRCKVVVDSGCGASYHITPYLLKEMGCDVVALNCYPSGIFPRNIEPTESSLDELIKTTIALGADLGIAHDGDADRTMVIDNEGRFIPGDKLLAILAQGVGAKEVVTTVDASMSIDELGFSVFRTKVGDVYVSEKLRERGDWGGEPSGAWVFPGISLCPDGIYAAAQIVTIASQQKLSQLVDELPSYPLLRGSITCHESIMSRLEQELMDMKPLSVMNIDGIRLDFGDGWLLVRASGTEPKIRITAEAKSETRAHLLFQNVTAAIKRCMEASKRE